jgi:hypothetical protein
VIEVEEVCRGAEVREVKEVGEVTNNSGIAVKLRKK